MMKSCRPSGRYTEGRKLGTREKDNLLGLAALMAMLILAPSALAQDLVEGEDDVLTAEREATVVEHGELEQIAGQPLPKQVPD